MAAVLSGGASVALVAVTGAAAVCLARVLMVGGIGARDTAMAVGPTVFLLLASVSAVTSSVRSVPALTAHDSG